MENDRAHCCGNQTIFLLFIFHDCSNFSEKNKALPALNFVTAAHSADAIKGFRSAVDQNASARCPNERLHLLLSLHCDTPSPHLLVLTDKVMVIVIFFFQWSGTLPLSSSHFLCEERHLRRCFWQLISVWTEELWLLFSLCQNPQEPQWTQNTEQHLVCEQNRRRDTLREKNAPICRCIPQRSASYSHTNKRDELILLGKGFHSLELV